MSIICNIIESSNVCDSYLIHIPTDSPVVNLCTGAAKENKKKCSSTFNPAKSNYHPVEDACWNLGQK